MREASFAPQRDVTVGETLELYGRQDPTLIRDLDVRLTAWAVIEAGTHATRVLCAFAQVKSQL